MTTQCLERSVQARQCLASCVSGAYNAAKATSVKLLTVPRSSRHRRRWACPTWHDRVLFRKSGTRVPVPWTDGVICNLIRANIPNRVRRVYVEAGSFCISLSILAPEHRILCHKYHAHMSCCILYDVRCRLKSYYRVGLGKFDGTMRCWQISRHGSTCPTRYSHNTWDPSSGLLLTLHFASDGDAM
jgi:hypothetical protein